MNTTRTSTVSFKGMFIILIIFATFFGSFCASNSVQNEEKQTHHPCRSSDDCSGDQDFPASSYSYVEQNSALKEVSRPILRTENGNIRGTNASPTSTSSSHTLSRNKKQGRTDQKNSKDQKSKKTKGTKSDLSPTPQPILAPATTDSPTSQPTLAPVKTPAPTNPPTLQPTVAPVATPSPTNPPTLQPTLAPVATPAPTNPPTLAPVATPAPTNLPTLQPTLAPVATPAPTNPPTLQPTLAPVATPAPTNPPTLQPTLAPVATPAPTDPPTLAPVATPAPTNPPTLQPTLAPVATPAPTNPPTLQPTLAPVATPAPTNLPTLQPTLAPVATPAPTNPPTLQPTLAPVATPAPTNPPTLAPVATPAPTNLPTLQPTLAPVATRAPTNPPTLQPTLAPVATPAPTNPPTLQPTLAPVATPAPTNLPTLQPTLAPVATPAPTNPPTLQPTLAPVATPAPTNPPTLAPVATPAPTNLPTLQPTLAPVATPAPTNPPTLQPTLAPVATPAPTNPPTLQPTLAPVATPAPTNPPTLQPTLAPVATPAPTNPPTLQPTLAPVATPAPTNPPTLQPTLAPVATPAPTNLPTLAPVATPAPATPPTLQPTDEEFVTLRFLSDLDLTISGPRVPPIANGAAGPFRLISVVNTAIQGQLWEGSTLFGPTLLSDMFDGDYSVSELSFPNIMYDLHHERFVLVVTPHGSTDDSKFLLAISKSNAPLSASSLDWWFHTIDACTPPFCDSLWMESAKIAVDEEAIYVTSNMFTVGGDTFGGSFLWILDKDRFYSNNDELPLPGKIFQGSAFENVASLQPAIVRYSTGIPGENVGTYLVSHSCNSGFVTFRVNDPLGPLTTFTRSDVPLTGKYECDLQDAPQLGSTGLIETNDSRVQKAVWVDNILWITFVAREIGTGETAIWYSQFSANGIDPVFIINEGGINGEDISSGAYTFAPSLDVNTYGVAAFGFTASSSSIFAGAYVTILNLDGSFEPSEAVKEGEGPYFQTFSTTTNFWSSYSGMSLDPLDDNCFWAFHQYAREDTCLPIDSSIASEKNSSDPLLEPLEQEMQSVDSVNATGHQFMEGDVRRLQDQVGCWGTAWARLCAAPQCPVNTVQLTSPGFGEIDENAFNLWLDLDVSRTEVATFYLFAHSRWSTVITGDSTASTSIEKLPENNQGPAGIPEILDDLYIYGYDECIDGESGSVGFFGPLVLDPDTSRPITGIMALDRADIPREIANGRLEAIILHEMGHVLGIGDLWDTFNLRNPDNKFVGSSAISVWQNEYGCPGLPPIETEGSFGTYFVHWEESTLQDELMTASYGSLNPLSSLTIASLEDLGYTVDYAAANPYCPPSTASFSCTCATGVTSVSETEKVPPLSEAGLLSAEEFGMSMLESAHRDCGEDGTVCSLDEGLLYVGDKIIIVLYQEEDRIYEVVVTSDPNIRSRSKLMRF
ncbi:laminin G domain containing protein [Nitzschia inconspicua]|uniref:Laminin G domain containing protein n=1 Tax=Nitzschia inconspicua TaxID=303405 RepID=A0A9K3LVP8_9STRA|nr:laminin G domain containing protein [Nitzschia inconspicua]